MSTGAILVAEDDDLLRQLIAMKLRQAGYVVCEAQDGQAALDLSVDVDLLILDRKLPAPDGLEVLRQIRARGDTTPAMFLTSLGELGERVRGLDSGADDYMVKPFDEAEFLARVRALIRRPRGITHDMITRGELRLDMTNWRAFFAGRELSLTAQDMTLLAVFLRRPSRVFTRESLLNLIGASADVTPAAVEHALSRLRKKLEQNGATEIIETVRGVGYRLNARFGV